MDWLREVSVPAVDTDVLLKHKVMLSREGLLSPVLRTNLDFVMGAVDALPSVVKKNAEVHVEGEQLLLVFRAGEPQLHLMVTQDHEGPKLYQKITVKKSVYTSDIQKAYFVGHNCPHKVSCLEQAINNLRYIGNNELKIICKELRITFTLPEPDGTIVVPLNSYLVKSGLFVG